MFFASVGEESEIDFFEFYLAEKLGKTLRELDEMDYAEYAAWSSYYKVKAQQEELARKVARHG